MHDPEPEHMPITEQQSCVALYGWLDSLVSSGAIDLPPLCWSQSSMNYCLVLSSSLTSLLLASSDTGDTLVLPSSPTYSSSLGLSSLKESLVLSSSQAMTPQAMSHLVLSRPQICLCPTTIHFHVDLQSLDFIMVRSLLA